MVSSSIQPTSRPTGIDDDIGGNDKAGALTATGNGTELERSAQRLLKPGQFDRVLAIYGTSPARMHLFATKKGVV
jgi:hypothetical protein